MHHAQDTTFSSTSSSSAGGSDPADDDDMDFIGDALPPGTLSFDVVLDAFVGEGTSGAVVHTATSNADGREYAVKSVELVGDDEVNLAECKLHASLPPSGALPLRGSTRTRCYPGRRATCFRWSTHGVPSST